MSALGKRPLGQNITKVELITNHLCQLSTQLICDKVQRTVDVANTYPLMWAFMNKLFWAKGEEM
jgi:hypothetical protein